MANATTTSPGSVILAGDLKGHANAPELSITGVIGGSYTGVTLVVDTKGRVIQVTGTDILALPGVEATSTSLGYTKLPTEFSGTGANPILGNSGVVAGSYTNPTVTVNAKGRITAVTNGIDPTPPDATSTTKGLIRIGGLS